MFLSHRYHCTCIGCACPVCKKCHWQAFYFGAVSLTYAQVFLHLWSGFFFTHTEQQSCPGADTRSSECGHFCSIHRPTTGGDRTCYIVRSMSVWRLIKAVFNCWLGPCESFVFLCSQESIAHVVQLSIVHIVMMLVLTVAEMSLTVNLRICQSIRVCFLTMFLSILSVGWLSVARNMTVYFQSLSMYTFSKNFVGYILQSLPVVCVVK